MNITAFHEDKQAVLRFAATLQKASTPAELRALLFADTDAPYHSLDVLSLADNINALTDRLAQAICADFDALFAEES